MMKATRCVIAIAFVCGSIMAACSKDEPAVDNSQTEEVRSRGAAKQDTTKNDSFQGGVGFKLETDFLNDTTICF